MTSLEFFELFLEELKDSSKMRTYYKFLENPNSFEFRKNYFLSRLEFVEKNILPNPGVVWDCGCGYGTQCLFLAMNGVKTLGSTLEFYYDSIKDRKKFWNKYGNTELFEVNYENIFEKHPADGTIDYIVVGDTLHHLEPISEAIKIFYNTLKPIGKIVVFEENGNNLVQRLILFLRRGNKRIIEIDDLRLGKKIKVGNENIRSLSEWRRLFSESDFIIEEESVEYIRLFFQFFYQIMGIEKVISAENKIRMNYPLLREYFYFAMNYTVIKK